MKKRSLLVVIIAFLFPAVHHVNGQTITTVAGCGIGDDSLATHAEIFSPLGVAVDPAGNKYIADNGNHLIRKVDVSGTITTFAGKGIYGYTGDGGQATSAAIGSAYCIKADRFGNIFFADAAFSVIRKIDASGVIATVAGTGIIGFTGDGMPAVNAELNGPSDIAIDTFGNMYICDRANNRIRKVNTAGIISTIAGNSGVSSPTFNGPAVSSGVGTPFRLATDDTGNLFIASYNPWYIMKIDRAGILTKVAGTGIYGHSGDGGPATAAMFSAPCGLILDNNHNIYFSDIDAGSVRKIDVATGIVSTIAGDGNESYSGDGGPATAAALAEPEDLCFDAAGNLYIADLGNNRIRMVSAAGVISTLAGQNGLFGEGYPGPNAELSDIQGLTSDAAGNIYIADIGNQRVRMISAATGKITTFAGGGISCGDNSFSGDGGPATDARFYYPSAMAFDAAGNMYICDQDNQRIRKVNTAGVISTVAGNGTTGFAGNGSTALNAEFHFPTGVTADEAGNVYVVDNNNQIVRKINAAGVITTIAGSRVAGYGGDGSAATQAQLSYPVDVAVDEHGNVYVSDQGNSRIRKIDTNGIITTVAGSGTSGYSGDNGPATDAELSFPQGIKYFKGRLFIADANNNSIRMIDSFGVISTLAGAGSAGFSGDGGLAISAQLNNPTAVAIDAAGDLYIADQKNQRVRKVSNALALSVNTSKTTANIAVYPNPAHNSLNIVNAANSLVIIDDMTGKEVMNTKVGNNKEALDISHFVSGVYMVRIIDANGRQKTVTITKE